MRKSQKILVASGVGVLALIAVAAIAGPIVYRDFIAAPAAEAPSLGADESVLSRDGAALDPADLAGEWSVGEGSEAGYRVDEVLNGTDVTVTGRTSDVTGTFTIADSGRSLDAARLTVDVASIATDNSSRDAYFRDQAMRADEFPTATFELTTPVELEAVPAAGEAVQAQAVGDLTIAGVTRSVTADVSVRSDGRVAEIAGSIPIVFADFGVQAPSFGFVQVEPSGAVEFQLTAERGPAG